MHKLPPLLAIQHALKAVVNFRNAGVKIALPWIVVLAGVSLLDRNFSSTEDSPGAMYFRSTEILIAALGMVVFSSIAVNWHRYILLDEVTASEKIFRLDHPVWSYAGRTLLIMLTALAPALALGAMVANILPGFYPLLAIPFFVAGIYVLRMSVALPAIALGHKDFGIGAALQATQGNNWQFAGLLLLNGMVLLATFLVVGIALTIVGSVSMTAGSIFAVALSIPANLFLSLFSISLLSSLYGFFVEKRSF